jgi:hypothetical protein
MLLSIVIFVLFFFVIPSLWMKFFIDEMDRNGKLQLLAVCFISCTMGGIILSGPVDLKGSNQTYEEWKAQGDRNIKWWTNHLAHRRLSVIKNPKRDCQAFLHEGVFNIIDIGDLQEIEEIKNLCIFDNTDIHLKAVVALSHYKEIFLLGHGAQTSSGKDSFAGGLRYEDFREIAKQEGKQIAILSCRGSQRRNDLYFKYKFETFEYHKTDALSVSSHIPHLEDGLWVYGKSGFLTNAALKLQYRGWKQQMSMIK